MLSDIAAYRETVGTLPDQIKFHLVADPRDLGSAISSLLERGNNGVQTVRTWHDTTAQTLEVYRSVCDLV